MKWWLLPESDKVIDRREKKATPGWFTLSGLGLGMARLRARFIGPRKARFKNPKDPRTPEQIASDPFKKNV